VRPFRKAARRGDVSPSAMSGNAAEERTTPRPKGLRLFGRRAALARQARAAGHARCHAALLNTKTAAINVTVFMFTTTEDATEQFPNCFSSLQQRQQAWRFIHR